MKLLINAYTLKIGGGESIGLGVIDALYQIRSQEGIFHVLIPKTEAYRHFQSSENIHIHRVPSFFTDYLPGRLLSVFYLVYLVYKLKPDTIFSMGNYAIPLKHKQLVLLHWPYIVYPDSIAWKQMPFLDFLKRKVRAFIVRQRLRYASAITVQTALMKKRVQEHLSFSGAIHVVESATALDLKVPENNSENKKKTALDRITEIRNQFPKHRFLLFISMYYSHKNLEVLLPLAQKIKQNKVPFKLLISLSPGQTKASGHFLLTIKKQQLEDTILNLGSIARNELSDVYRSSHALFMPTLLETYGITYMEAMMAGIPIFTSNLDFAQEACAEAAFYFNPLDPESIYSTLNKAYEHPDLITQKILLGKERALHRLSWQQITQNYLDILKNL